MRRVVILKGLKEFIGKTGTVSHKEGTHLRVILDQPVEIEGIGKVRDDLWEPSCLRTIRAPR